MAGIPSVHMFEQLKDCVARFTVRRRCMVSPELPQTESDADIEGFQLEVNEVAELLGVTRTRVSQLTSAGQLSFERRRVGSRSRLFYKRSEVLAHQRGFYGRQAAAAYQQMHSRTSDSGSASGVSERFGASAQFRTYESLAGADSVTSAMFQRLDEQNQHNRRQLAKIVEIVSAVSAKGRTAGTDSVSADALRAQDISVELMQNILVEVCGLAEQLSAQQNLLLDVIESSRSIKKDLHQILNLSGRNGRIPRLAEPQIECNEIQNTARPRKAKVSPRGFRSSGVRKVLQR